MITAEQIAQQLNAVKTGTKWVAECPLKHPSLALLSIKKGADGRTLLSCSEGCSLDVICIMLGIRAKDLKPDIRRRPRPARSRVYARKTEVAKRFSSSSYILIDNLVSLGILTRIKLPGSGRGYGFLVSEVKKLTRRNPQ